MRISIVVLCLLAIYINIPLSAQDHENPFFECLVGTPINNPVFLQMIEENDWEIEKYCFSENKCKIVFRKLKYLQIEDGIITRISSGKFLDWNMQDLPESWNIKKEYKQMRKSDKSYPKKPKDKPGAQVTITKNIGDIILNVTYKYMYLEINDKLKRKMIYTHYDLTADRTNENCGKLPEIPQAYKEILGEDGDNLSEWICENFGKDLPESFLKKYFIPIKMVENYDETPYFDRGSYYGYHPIFWGNYYLSFDSSVILRTQGSTLKGIGFYPCLIDCPIFPSIDRKIDFNYLTDIFGDNDTSYMQDENEYFLRTPSLEIMFNFSLYDSLQFVWINQLFSDEPLIHSNEFPLKDHKNGWCIFGDCVNGEGTYIDKKGRASTGKFYKEIPYGTHNIQYRYGVEKKKFFPNLYDTKRTYFSPEQKVHLSKIQLPDLHKAALEEYNYFFVEELHQKVTEKAGATVHLRMEGFYQYGIVSITEENTILNMHLIHEGATDRNLEDPLDQLALLKTTYYYYKDTDAYIHLNVDGDKNPEHEYLVKIFIYKRMHDD